MSGEPEVSRRKRVALITGAGRGIGQSIAYRLAAEGYYIILVSRTLSELEFTLKQIKKNNGYGECLICDLSDQQSVYELVSAIQNIDVLINNVGCSGGGYTETMDDALWHKIISVNLNSVYYMSKAVLRDKKMNTPGAIINIASTGGKQGVVHGAAYSASKHGVIGFTKALGLELAKQNITVNAVCPGFVETLMSDKVRKNYAQIWNVELDEVKKRIEARIPLGRYIQPDEVAGMVSYLASPLARGITAQALNVCGGLGNY